MAERSKFHTIGKTLASLDAVTLVAQQAIEVAVLKAKIKQEEQIKLLNLETEWQAHISAYYNVDESDEERKVRKSIIEGYSNILLLRRNLYIKSSSTRFSKLK